MTYYIYSVVAVVVAVVLVRMLAVGGVDGSDTFHAPMPAIAMSSSVGAGAN